jgi:hypothetical protein
MHFTVRYFHFEFEFVAANVDFDSSIELLDVAILIDYDLCLFLGSGCTIDHDLVLGGNSLGVVDFT